jgi:hypothetical protein
MNGTRSFLLAAWTVTLAGCATTSFDSSWKSPDATPVTSKGKKVVAIVMMKDVTPRRAAEDALVRALNERGAVGIALYTLMPPGSPTDEESVKAMLQQSGAAGAVIMRPVAVDKEPIPTTVTYGGPMYGGFYGGYYGYGWGSAYGGMTVSGGGVTTIVSVETLVYSLEQNKLLWAGRSKTSDPANIDSLVREIADAVAAEMQREGLIQK